MMMMHVYRKFVIFNIYIYTWFEGYYIYFLKCYWGFFATESTLLGHGAIKKRRATYLQYTPISSLYHLWLHWYLLVLVMAYIL